MSRRDQGIHTGTSYLAMRRSGMNGRLRIVDALAMRRSLPVNVS
jgi:hypothetical protein